MILYTCPWQKRSSSWHPCGVAAKALDDAGHGYEIRVVRGQLSMPCATRVGASSPAAFAKGSAAPAGG